LQDYDLGKPLKVSDPKHPVKKSMELGPRDILSQAFMKEQEKKRTMQGSYGQYVHLDIRHLGEKIIDEKLPFVRELVTKCVGIDPVYKPPPVRPVVHYCMRGGSTRISIPRRGSPRAARGRGVRMCIDKRCEQARFEFAD
jgi:fumarate reductase flavoprotein subunit